MTSSNKAGVSKNGRLNKVIIGCILLAISITIGFFSINTLNQPKRSVVNFCEVAKDQKKTLLEDDGYKNKLVAYKKLEAVAPNDIEPDIKLIRQGYENIIRDPSSMSQIGVDINKSEYSRNNYIKNNCRQF